MSYFSLLPNELLILLALYLLPHKLRRILSDVPDFNRLIHSTEFWRRIWKRDISSYLLPPTNAYEKYLEIYKGNTIFTLAKHGYDILLYPQLWNNYTYDIALLGAASGGQLPIVKEILKREVTEVNTALAYVSRINNLEIINLLLAAGANDFNLALLNAAESGHPELVKLFLELGANNYNEAIERARMTDNKEIINLIRQYQMQV